MKEITILELWSIKYILETNHGMIVYSYYVFFPQKRANTEYRKYLSWQCPRNLHKETIFVSKYKFEYIHVCNATIQDYKKKSDALVRRVNTFIILHTK
jgi:hypothetical protein